MYQVSGISIPDWRTPPIPARSGGSGERRHIRVRRAKRAALGRQRPSVVRMASQTLLSSRTRTREIEDLLPGQTGFPLQAVEGGQQAIQFSRLGKKGLINHVLSPFLSAPPARANGGRNFLPVTTLTDSDAPLTGLPRVSARLYPSVAAARESAAIFRCAGPRVRRSTESPLRLQHYGAAASPDIAGTLLVARAYARRAARGSVRVEMLGMDADFRSAAIVTAGDATLSSLPSDKTVNVRMTAVNDAGESGPRAKVPAVVG